jgi:hypothetical protein
LHKPVPVRQSSIEVFNRELDRFLRGGAISEGNFPSEDARDLELAQKLAGLDFSANTTIRKSLRHKFSERSAHYPGKLASFHRIFVCFEGRTRTGIAVATLMVFVLIFRMLGQPHVSAYPAYHTLTASAALPGQQVIPLTVTTSHNQEIYPRPVPTPMAVSASNLPVIWLPECTPGVDPSLGTQLPILTTTISK